MSYEDQIKEFGNLSDIRMHLLCHPDREMVQNSCLHFLGDRFQAISSIINNGLKQGDLVCLDDCTLFVKNSLLVDEIVKFGPYSTLLMIKELRPGLWEVGVMSELVEDSIEWVDLPKSNYIINIEQIIGSVRTFTYNTKFSEKEYCESVSAFPDII